MTKIVLRRLVEMIIGCVAASALFTYCKTGSSLTQVTNEVRFFHLFLIILFMIYNGYMMRHLYLKVDDSFDYYLLNGISIILFAVISIVFKFVAGENIYNWTFSFTDIYYNMFDELGIVIAVILFYVTLMISVFFSEKYYDRIISR